MNALTPPPNEDAYEAQRLGISVERWRKHKADMAGCVATYVEPDIWDDLKGEGYDYRAPRGLRIKHRGNQ